MDYNELWKILRDEINRPCYLPPEKPVLQVKKQQLEPDMEQQTGSKLGKEYIKTVYCHPDYLTSTQSTPWKIQAGWLKSWNQDCRKKYQQPQICRWYHSSGRKWRGTEETFDEGENSEKAYLKLNIQKTRFISSGPITSWQIDGGKVEILEDFNFLCSKSTVASDWSTKWKKPLILGRKGMTSLDSAEELMLLNCGVGEDSWESMWLQGNKTS